MEKKLLPGLLSIIILILIFPACTPKDSAKNSHQDNASAIETIIEDNKIEADIIITETGIRSDNTGGENIDNTNISNNNTSNTDTSNTGISSVNKTPLGPEHSFTITNEQIIIRNYDKDAHTYSYSNFTGGGYLTNNLGYPGTIENGKFSVTVNEPDDGAFAQSFFNTREWKSGMEDRYSPYQYTDVYFSDLSVRYYDLVMLIREGWDNNQISQESYEISYSDGVVTAIENRTIYKYVDKPLTITAKGMTKENTTVLTGVKNTLITQDLSISLKAGWNTLIYTYIRVVNMEEKTIKATEIITPGTAGNWVHMRESSEFSTINLFPYL